MNAQRNLLPWSTLLYVVVVLAAVSTLTGFKVNFLPFKLCPFIFTASAGLIVAGALL